MNASKIASAALALGLLSGCSPESTTPPATQVAPTAGPSVPVSSGLSVAWEPYLRLGGMVDMVHGSDGWVALGECERGACSTTATVWHSADLEAWETIQLPKSGDIVPISLSVNADGYFISAYDFDNVGGHDDAFLQVWRSSDGRLWERYGELRLGACEDADCPLVRGVGRAPNRALVVGAVAGGNDPGQAFVSFDGYSWQEMTIATFANGAELKRINVDGVEPAPADLFLYGEACGDTCAMTVWSTRDGEHWAEEQSFGPDVDSLSVAADDAQRVVAVARCQSPTECTTDVWTGVRSTAWTNVLPAVDVADPQVVWTGDAFILVGVRDALFVSYISPDGLNWAELPGQTLGGTGSCGSAWIAGGDETVMFGVPGCALWKGTLREGV